jgi:hypothetical protein
MVLIAEYGIAQGAAPIKGLWTTTLPGEPRIQLTVNGSGQEDDGLLPWHARVDIAGWPALILNAFDGVGMIGAEDLLCERLLSLLPPKPAPKAEPEQMTWLA